MFLEKIVIIVPIGIIIIIRAIFAIGIGVITILIRVWGAYPEGISFAILIMNATVPLINMYAKPSRFGGSNAKKK